MEELLKKISADLDDIKRKLSMKDSIMQIKNARFYLPNHPEDCIQKSMANCCDYWDTHALNIIDKYLPDNAVILDIGANIGSHSIYWAIEKNARKVYAFEPLTGAYEALAKNVKLNKLNRKVIPYNLGLFSHNGNASITHYNISNIGNTSFCPNPNGVFKFIKLDNFKTREKIDLIKIDVEGAEAEVLKGAAATISTHKPIIVIETYNHRQEVDTILKLYGYTLTDTIREGEDYIYKPVLL